jgi:hypothetical protein
MTTQTDVNAMREKANIPQKYKDMLRNVLKLMEEETGNMYEFTVNTFGIHQQFNCIIGHFNRMCKIKVSNMKPGYEELEGIYDNIGNVNMKIKMLCASETYYDFKEYVDKQGRSHTIGKCKVCHSYNDDNPKHSPNYIDNSTCQSGECPIRFSKWEEVHLDMDAKIWHGGYAGISVWTELGTWEMIK